MSYEVNGMIFSPDSNYFAYTINSYPESSTQDGIYIYDLTSRQIDKTLLHPTATQLAFSSDEQYLASGGYDGSIHLWDLETSEFTEIRQANGNGIRILDFVNDDLLAIGLLTDTSVSMVEYWDIQNEKPLPVTENRTFSEYWKDGVSRVRLSDNVSFQLWSVFQDKNLALLENVQFVYDVGIQNNLVITPAAEAGIEFRRLDTGEILHSIRESGLTQARFSSSGNHVILWGPDGNVEIWGVPAE